MVFSQAKIQVVPEVDADGNRRFVARIICKRCGAVGTRIHNRAKLPSPDEIAKVFGRMGWSVDRHRPANSICMECNKKARVAEDKEVEKLVDSWDRKDAKNIAIAKQLTEYQEAARRKNGPANPPTDNAQEESDPMAINPVQSLTTDQKAGVRRLLDSHFDDAKGIYLGDYSDKKIAKELNIPWAAVRDIREISYGPIRETPEMTAIRAELETLKAGLTAAGEAWDRAYKAGLTKIEDLQGRLEKAVSPAP